MRKAGRRFNNQHSKNEYFCLSDMALRIVIGLLGKGIRSAVLLCLFLSVSGSDLRAQQVHDHCRVQNICMPFPGRPDHSVQEAGGVTVESYTYAVPDTHLRLGAQVYTGLPGVSNPAASVLSGFTRGHRVRSEEHLEVNGIRGIWITSEATVPTPSAWNTFAFEFEGRVYLWMETFQTDQENGSERALFQARLKEIRPF